MEPLPRFSKCCIFLHDVGTKHQQTKSCIKNASQIELHNRRECNESLAKETVFTVFGDSIEKVHEFKYLGRIVTDNDDDSAALMMNLKKASQTWGHLYRLLSQESGRNIKTVVSIY